MLVSGFSLAAGAASAPKVIICHYEGHNGSNPSHTIEVAPSAVSTHLASGFDYIGPCLPTPEGSTSTTEETTTTEETSTTVGSTPTTAQTPTTVASSPTTLAPTSTTVETSTTVASDLVTAETSTTLAPPSTTTSEDGTGVGASGTDQTTSTIAPENDEAVSAVADELPYTGANMMLVIPGALLMAIGAFAVFVTGALGRGSAAHASSRANGFALGLHRGRHQA